MHIKRLSGAVGTDNIKANSLKSAGLLLIAVDWVNGLDPMPAGGWERRLADENGTWALFTSTHQRNRTGQIITIWQRWEFLLDQTSSNAASYRSSVEKNQFDCVHAMARSLSAAYYRDNNLNGDQRSVEVGPKAAAWYSIIPGTIGEQNFKQECLRG